MKNTDFPKVLGTDGKKKMGKSENNHIELALTPEETNKVVSTMVTDPQRVRRTDPGNPDVCNVFTLHKYFSTDDKVAAINTECRKADIGCVDCKRILSDAINEHLDPFRERRAELSRNPQYIWDILHDGADRARKIARNTIAEVKSATGIA